MPSSSPRVLLLTAGMGSGHVEVAGELARRMRARAAAVEVVDVVRVAGRAGERLVRTYSALLRWAPWVYDTAMRVWSRAPGLMERLTASGASEFEQVIDSAIDRVQPDLVVSTYNLASQCLGRVARRRRLSAVTATVVIDPGPHPYWVSDQIDLHLAPTAPCATALRDFGAQTVVETAPVLRPEFAAPSTQAEARRRLGLSPDARTVLVNGGSWAVGGVERTIDALRPGLPDLDLAVLCGRDDALRRRLHAVPGVRAVGWTHAMVDHLAAADVVVDNAGGLTFWEARACATPVVLFHPLPGHGRLNAEALSQAGWARQAHSSAELRHYVAADGLPPGRSPAGRRPAADEVLLAAVH